MTKYLVKTTMVATPENVNFADENIHIYYHGKDQKMVACEGNPWINAPTLDRAGYFIHEYGYDRKCDAIRSWCYKHPQNDEHWTSTVGIIRVEV